jgi:hypothetical protein
MVDFFRFPHTPHIAWLAKGEPRDDKVLSPAEAQSLLSHPVVVEEKIDGANLGFSLDADGRLQAQNRGQYLQGPFAGQFARLPDWLAQAGDRVELALLGLAETPVILFGEWCAARHSLGYDHLPDWFLLFDVYDKTQGRFWSAERRNVLAETYGFALPFTRLDHLGPPQSDAQGNAQPLPQRFARRRGDSSRFRTLVRSPCQAGAPRFHPSHRTTLEP